MHKITIICILMLLISFAGAINLPKTDICEKTGSVKLPNKLPTIAYTIEWTLTLNHRSCLGCTPVGDTLLWVSSAGRTGTADPNWILIYNLRTILPTLIDSFLQATTDVWGYRDMCFHNGYVYAGADSTLHKINPATHAVVGTYPVTGISGEGIIRALTDNNVEDSLYTADWNSPIYKFSTNGGQARTVANNSFYIYGLAYDPHGFVWGSLQSSDAQLIKFSYPAFTPLDYCVIPELDGPAGGCEMWEDTFLLYLTQGTTCRINCFRLYTPSFPHDVGVDEIISPGDFNVPNTPMTPIAIVKNYGTTAEGSFPVTCSIFGTGNVLRYADTQTISSLGIGDTARVIFTSWTPSIQENLTVKIRTHMTGDQNPSNDQKTTLTVIAPYLLLEKFNLIAFPPSGWRDTILSGTYNWQRFTTGSFPTCTPYEGNAMAGYKSYNASGGSEAQLISPSIVLGSAPTPCTLKFWMMHDPGFGAAPDSIKIQISPDGTSFTWVASIARYDVTTQWTEHVIYLGTQSGTIYIGFLAHSGYGNNMYIDYVSLTSVPLLPQRDVGMNAIRYPMATHSKDIPMIPIGKVKNFGSAAQAFPVVCSIIGTGGAVRYTNTQTVPTLAPNDTALVNFGSWTPTIAENITVIMRTLLTNDSNPDNDRMTQSSTIIAGFLYESFESTTFPPAGWQAVIGNGTYNWTRATAGTNPTCSPYHGTAMATYSCFDAAAGSYARLITPQIPVGNNNPCTLKFYMYHNDEYSGSGGYGPDSVKVETSTNGTTFTQVAAIARYGTVNQWQEHTVYLGTFSGNLWVSLLGWSDYGGNIFVDLVRINGRTGIEEIKPNIITMTALHAPKPNPATNGLVKISFTIAAPTKASLKIYDVSGKLVKTLVDNNLNTGIYNNTWNGTDDNNYEIADGIYFCTLKTDNNNYTKKLVFTR